MLSPNNSTNVKNLIGCSTFILNVLSLRVQSVSERLTAQKNQDFQRRETEVVSDTKIFFIGVEQCIVRRGSSSRTR